MKKCEQVQGVIFNAELSSAEQAASTTAMQQRCRALYGAQSHVKKNKLPVFSVSLAKYEFLLTVNRTEYEYNKNDNFRFVIANLRHVPRQLVPYICAIRG